MGEIFIKIESIRQSSTDNFWILLADLLILVLFIIMCVYKFKSKAGDDHGILVKTSAIIYILFAIGYTCFSIWYWLK